MKRLFVFFMIIFLSITLVSCYSNGSDEMSKQTSSSYDKFVYDDLNTLPKYYSANIAKEKGDVVILHKVAVNLEKIDKFLDSVKKEKPNMIRITSYTPEGYALIEDIIYDGTYIKINCDTSRDINADRENATYYASKIMKKEKDGGILYIAKLSNGESFDIAYINEDILTNQDR